MSTITAAAKARERHDDFRRAMMLEPRGHDGMYGVSFVIEPDDRLGHGFSMPERFAEIRAG